MVKLTLERVLLRRGVLLLAVCHLAAAAGCTGHSSEGNGASSQSNVASPAGTTGPESVRHQAVASGPSFYASVIKTDGPVAYYRLNEASGTVASDSSGHGHNGTYNGTVALSQGPLLTSDANANGVSFGSGYMTEQATWTNQAVTAECWTKPTAADVDVNASPRIMGNAWADHTSAGFMLYINQGKPGFWAGWKSTYGTTALSAGTVYHLVGTYSSSAGNTLYVNGTQVANSPGTGPNPQKGDSPTTYVGALNAVGGSGITAHFQGEIADCAVYDHAVTPLQVANHYKAGSQAHTMPPGKP
jgi:hypothetical protein